VSQVIADDAQRGPRLFHKDRFRRPPVSQVIADDAQRGPRLLHKDRFRRPPAQRLDPHLPGSGKQVQETKAHYVVAPRPALPSTVALLLCPR